MLCPKQGLTLCTKYHVAVPQHTFAGCLLQSGCALNLKTGRLNCLFFACLRTCIAHARAALYLQAICAKNVDK
ncbi:hypothetical protein BVG80_16105 [Sphingobacteriales bacterium TSM_CSM]|nr:hypothetical protein BVG80_16105 [Sphingobacteriales bacterium TSM_CSM]